MNTDSLLLKAPHAFVISYRELRLDVSCDFAPCCLALTAPRDAPWPPRFYLWKQSRSKQTNQKWMAWWNKPTGVVVGKDFYRLNWPPSDQIRGLLHNRESCLVLQTWSTSWIGKFTVYSRKIAAVVLLNGHNLPFKMPSNNYVYFHTWVLLLALVKNASIHSEE